MILDIYEKCNADEGCRERWQRWEHHRKKINSILEEQVFNQGKIRDAIILGAGRCEDIDLKFLLERVEHLTLVDYDYSSMEKALDRHLLTIEEKARVILKGNVEFTGLYQKENIEILEKKIMAKESCESISAFIMKSLKEYSSDLKTLSTKNKYSLVMSGAVHSQLIIPYVQMASAQAEYKEYLMKEAAAVADAMAENYNESLLSLVRPGGRMFSYFDVLELSEKSRTIQYEAELNRLQGEEREECAEEIMYQNGGVAGARYGYQHLHILTGKYKPCETSWIWSFRDNKKYYVRSLCFSTENFLKTQE